MPWFAADSNLESHEKVLALRAALQWSEDQVLLGLFRFLAWLRREHPDGWLPAEVSERLPWIMRNGERNGSAILAAMLQVHMIDEPTTQRYRAHNWMKRNGRFLNSNARNAATDSVAPPQFATRARARARARAEESEAVSSLRSETHARKLADPEPSVGSDSLGSGSVELVGGLVERLTMPKSEFDPRVKLWDIARGQATASLSADQLMEVLCWLWYKRGVHDWTVLGAVARTAPRAKNFYAMFQEGGKALESFIGEAAVARAEAEQANHRSADAAMGLRIGPRTRKA